MIVTQKHLIKRQTIELRIPRSGQAHQLQAEVSRVYRQRIIPLIDRYCNELSAPDRLHRIDLLELDLGAIDHEHLEADFVAKVGPALRLALAAQIEAQDQAGASSDRTAHTRSQLELLACFARTGSLPWWADATLPRLVDECLQHLLAKMPEALRRLLEQLVREPPALQRLVLQIGDARLAELAGLLIPSFNTSLTQDAPAFVQLLQQCAGAINCPVGRLRQSAWRNLLHVAGVGGPQYGTPEALYRAILKRVAVDVGTSYDALIAALQHIVQTDGTTIRRELKDALDGLAQDGSRATSVAAGPEEQAASSPSPAEPELDLGFSDADALYIGNAGLVILWPFLGHFFAHVGLLEDKQFRDVAAQHRAVGLLQYLATGDALFPEYLLPLNKALCGMEVTEVFEFGEPLLETEAEECTNLLSAVIAQAPILRDMSPSGLRGSFLLRQGQLSTRDGQWLLRVERETHDIVLDRFPWGVSIVRLPWMKAMMQVEW